MRSRIILAGIAVIAGVSLAGCDSSPNRADRPSTARELNALDRAEDIGIISRERAPLERSSIRSHW
ncbi:MAG: hypothetical protein K2W85_02925 [Phycisphaerales bacterium]|nr:hypothetical protein [Phycisphaerales bacterium]